MTPPKIVPMHGLRIAICSVAVVLTAAGCSIFEGYSGYRARAGSPPVERPRLEPINRNYFILESPEQSVVGEPQIVFTREEDTFSDLAREYGLGYDELVAANPHVDPWLPGVNTPILLPTQYVLPDLPEEGVILNIASKRLFYYPPREDGDPVQVMTYPIGIGRVGWETPLGQATVVSRATDPHWYVPLSVREEHAADGDPLPAVVPPGPDNPLGHRVLKLDMPGYLIHGTNQPYGVGMRVSHGCIRLYPENIEVLYSEVAIGEKVTIINEPYLAGWRDGELFFEAHAPLEDDTLTAEQRLERLFGTFGADARAFAGPAERDHARAIASDARGIPVRVRSADVHEVYERARVVRNTVTADPDAPTLAEVREILDAPAGTPDSREVPEQSVAD